MLKARRNFFSLSGQWSSLAAKALNKNICHLSRVVLHPSYRGGSLASKFIRKSSQSLPYPWIETLSQIAQFTPVFDSAGFQRAGKTSTPSNRSRKAHAAIYGCKPTEKKQLSSESHHKSRHAQPAYFIFDNRPQN